MIEIAENKMLNYAIISQNCHVESTILLLRH